MAEAGLAPRSGRPGARAAGALLAGCALSLALAIAALAVRADEAWVLRHLLVIDSSGTPLPWAPQAVRASAIVAAALLAITALRLRRLDRAPSAAALARVMLAALLALPVAEGALRLARSRRAEERRTLHERLGEPHPRWGWRFRPETAATVRIAGRDVPLAFDADGSRIAQPGKAPDRDAPSLVIAGESVALGHGLRWEETFAARAAASLGLQPVNLAVNGYGVDQAFLRLRELLPGLRAPRALVMVVVPVQLGRNLIDDHPRLSLREGGELEILPPASGFLAGLQLRSLLGQRLPLRSEAEVQRTVALTAALVRKTAALARAASAKPLFVVPSAGPERPLAAHAEWELLQSIFAAAGAPWILVDLPEGERLADGHPNPAGARHLAAAIVEMLAGTR